jgi:hypothetical protein
VVASTSVVVGIVVVVTAVPASLASCDAVATSRSAVTSLGWWSWRADDVVESSLTALAMTATKRQGRRRRGGYGDLRPDRGGVPSRGRFRRVSSDGPPGDRAVTPELTPHARAASHRTAPSASPEPDEIGAT